MSNKLDLDTLLKNDEEIWVLNTSRPKGKVTISFIEQGSQRSDFFQVPKTWIPVCISHTIPKDQLKNSRDFRDFLVKGYLKLVAPAEAQKIAQGKQFKDEHNRLFQGKFTESNRHIPDDDNFKPKPKNVSVVNARVKSLCERLHAKDIKATEGINVLKSIQEELTSVDLSYVISQSSLASVQKWAKKALGDKPLIMESESENKIKNRHLNPNA